MFKLLKLQGLIENKDIKRNLRQIFYIFPKKGIMHETLEKNICSVVNAFHFGPGQLFCSGFSAVTELMVSGVNNGNCGYKFTFIINNYGSNVFS